MIHAIATVLLSVAAFTLARNGWAVLETGNRVSGIAHFTVAGACLVGAGRAAWRWRRAVKRKRVPPRTSPLPPNEPSPPPPSNDSNAPSRPSRPRAGKTTRRTKKRR